MDSKRARSITTPGADETKVNAFRLTATLRTHHVCMQEGLLVETFEGWATALVVFDDRLRGWTRLHLHSFELIRCNHEN
jgi:hypothetical protein